MEGWNFHRATIGDSLGRTQYETPSQEFNEPRAIELAQHILPQGEGVNASNNCGQTRLHLAVLWSDTNTQAAVHACKNLLHNGARIDLKNKDGRTPLYIAAVNSNSFELTKVLLTTCRSLRPSLIQLYLIGKRTQTPLPKDVVFRCIAPHLIRAETQRQLDLLKQLLQEVVESTTRHRAHDRLRGNGNIQECIDKRLCHIVAPELSKLLNSAFVEELRQPIIDAFYEELGIKQQVAIKQDTADKPKKNARLKGPSNRWHVCNI